MTEHVALHVSPPDLTRLSDEELATFRAKIISTSREYRRKSNTAISKIEGLKKSWGRMLSLNGASSKEERKEVMAEFEQELLRYPAIYIAHATANALVILDSACRDEGLKRSPIGAGRKR